MGFGSGSLGGSGGGALKPFVPPPQAIVYDVWPGSLPQSALRQSYKEAPADIVKRTPMSKGPAKQRPLLTRGIKPPIPITMEMDAAQIATLKTFYQETLNGGTIPFQWVHPRLQEVRTFRFKKDDSHTITALDGGYYRVTMLLEVIL